jgi:phosphoenolpyruvate synthase/pyruvate phosphate dikinase
MKAVIFPVGGKASGLEVLRRCGLSVPPFVLWQEDVFSPALRLIAAGDTIRDAAGFLRQTIQETPWDLREEAQIHRDILKLMVNGLYAIAVRSSATDEDGHRISLAGQMDTFLNLRTPQAVLKAIRACQASVFSNRAVAYRKSFDLDWTQAKLTVILQRQLDPEVSGVLFTSDWGEGRSGNMIVSSLWGLGEGLVGGVLDADTFSLDEKGRVT